MELFANIILPLPLNQVYTYRVPSEMKDSLAIGMRVVVNFGNRKFYTGIVHAIHTERPTYADIKPISIILDHQPIVTASQLRLWEFVSTYYRAKLGDVYKVAVPSAMKPESETMLSINMDIAAQADLTAAEMELLDRIPQDGTISIGQLVKQSSSKSVLQSIRRLGEKGVLCMDETLVGKYKAKHELCFRLAPTLLTEEALQETLNSLTRSKKQLEFMLAYLNDVAPDKRDSELVVRKTFLEKYNFSAAIYNGLLKKGIIETVLRPIDRLSREQTTETPEYTLSEAQQTALDTINTHFTQKETVLLHGVTSSGKTEIYTHLIKQTLKQGKQVLLLVPEIGLTTQLAQRLSRVFGSKLGVSHSRSSDMERVEIWNNLLLNKGYEVILGVRSSVFLPFRDLGLVIVDEEHDASYKQQDPAPRYHARNIAQTLGHLHGAKVLLASATPSIESYTHCLTGKYALVSLTERYNNIAPPKIELVNLKESYRKKQMKGHFSLTLIAKIEETLKQGHQVILFQNRRGYAPYVECKSCGWVPRCGNCDVSLTYHKHFNKLTCHYCGHTQYLPEECPVCKQHDISSRGFGTEQVEHEVRELFPDAKVARMDLDTTRTKRSFQELIENFESQQIDILIGTQMVSKGLDFENVALIGILNADNLLFYPDFRSFERAFQLLVQVSGRAGRKKMQGEVLIQTSATEHPLMHHIMKNDYRAFFDSQMVERQQFKYPPYYRLIRIVLRHRDAQKLNKVSMQMADALRARFGNRLLGPDVPAVGRIQNMYIKHLLLKIEVSASFERAKEIIDQIMTEILTESDKKGTQIHLDVDPI